MFNRGQTSQQQLGLSNSWLGSLPPLGTVSKGVNRPLTPNLNIEMRQMQQQNVSRNKPKQTYLFKLGHLIPLSPIYRRGVGETKPSKTNPKKRRKKRRQKSSFQTNEWCGGKNKIQHQLPSVWFKHLSSLCCGELAPPKNATLVTGTPDERVVTIKLLRVVSATK